MHRILVDTCVWLDLAKDQQQQGILTIVEELIKRKELDIIVPRIVLDEFLRNKDRIIKENSQSLSSVFKRVKDVVEKFGDPKKKNKVLEQLNDVDFKIPTLGEAVAVSVTRIENILKGGTIIDVSDAVKLKAAQRAIDKKAPFHRQKNSINDAIIMEVYGDCLKDKSATGIKFGFVTHNKNDFSLPNGSDKIPHPDFASYFSKIKSQYFIKLAEAIHKIAPDLVTDMMIEEEWTTEPRSFTEMMEAENELTMKIWYNRHKGREYHIEAGKIKLIDKKDFTIETAQNTIVKEIWEGALKSAKKVEKKYGIENLGPWDDFEWGMLSGKLSAVRWAMGDEWDMLDT